MLRIIISIALFTTLIAGAFVFFAGAAPKKKNVRHELADNRYDADREGFEGKIYGTPVFVSIPRDAAKALRDSGAPLLIRGELRYLDGKSAEVVRAMLAGTDIAFPVRVE